MNKRRYRLINIALSNLAITAILLILVFLGIEVFLRLTLPVPDFHGLSEKTNDRVTVRMKPNLNAHLAGVAVTTNSDGYRDEEFSKIRSSEETLIGIVGDSVTFGQGVPQGQTYAALLEKNLNSLKPGRRFRVWNLGVCGYNTEQEYYVMESFLAPRKPDLIIVGYNLHNFQPIDLSRQTDTQTFQQAITNRVVGYIDELHTTHILKSRVGRLLRRIDPNFYASSYIDDINRNYSSEDGLWQTRRRFLEDMATLCKNNHIKLLVAILPIMVDFDHYPFLKSNQILTDFFKSRHIDYIDLLPYFRGCECTEFHVTLLDSHANAKAHKIFAGALSEHIRKTYLGAGEPQI